VLPQTVRHQLSYRLGFQMDQLERRKTDTSEILSPHTLKIWARLRTSGCAQKRASELSPHERAPWSNLSAAYFELGDYTQAISACNKALGLLSPTDTDSDTAKQKLLTRKAKSCFFAGLYEDAGAVIDTASSSSAEAETLSKGVQSYLNAAKHVEDLMKVRHEIVVNLPRYKPTL